MSAEILVIGDPWDTLDHVRDSSLHLIRVARELFGARTHWALPDGIFLRDGSLYVRTIGEVDGGELRSAAATTREFRSFHSIHWRADPPVTIATMRLWSLLAASGGERGVPFVNSPNALLTWNEKFAPLRFREWALPGLASNDEREWQAYFESRRGKQLVAKPSGDAASRGVQLLPTDWNSARSVLRSLRADQGPWLVLQEFDPTLLSEGETRVFVLGSEICGAINKRPHPKHTIMNLDVPPEERPRLSAAELSPAQSVRATEIASILAREGVYLATIDFIGPRILEINVTSPGLIGWLDERLPAGRKIAQRYWQGLFQES